MLKAGNQMFLLNHRIPVLNGRNTWSFKSDDSLWKVKSIEENQIMLKFSFNRKCNITILRRVGIFSDISGIINFRPVAIKIECWLLVYRETESAMHKFTSQK